MVWIFLKFSTEVKDVRNTMKKIVIRVWIIGVLISLSGCEDDRAPVHKSLPAPIVVEQQTVIEKSQVNEQSAVPASLNIEGVTVEPKLNITPSHDVKLP